jgi:hypothetical protein
MAQELLQKELCESVKQKSTKIDWLGGVDTGFFHLDVVLGEKIWGGVSLMRTSLRISK